VNKRTVEQDFL